MLRVNILTKKVVYFLVTLGILGILFILIAYYNEQNFTKQAQERINTSMEDVLSQEMSIPLTSKDFIVKDINNFIELGGIYENMETDEEITYSRYIDEDQAYDFFTYENFSVSVSPNIKNRGIIFAIDLLTPVFQTAREIKIGDNISDVFKKYGIVNNDRYNYYYKYGNKRIIFYVDENENVIGIKMDLI